MDRLLKNRDKVNDPEGYCASIMRKVEGPHPKAASSEAVVSEVVPVTPNLDILLRKFSGESSMSLTDKLLAAEKANVDIASTMGK